MAERTITEGTTHTIRAEGFHDKRDPVNVPLIAAGEDPTVFLDGATVKTAQVTDVSIPGTPVPIGGAQTLVADGSGGGYGVDLPHDFESSALVKGMRLEIVSTLEEGPVHWETPAAERKYLVV